MSGYPDYATLSVHRPSEGVLEVKLDRPKKMNAMNPTFFAEVRDLFTRTNEDNETRVIVLSANGKHFTAGLDLGEFGSVASPPNASKDPGRRAMQLQKTIVDYQASFNVIDSTRQPVIAAVHGICYGGGIDLTTACDIRYATKDVRFSIKEIDVGLAADIGTFPRILHATGNSSLARELSYTGRELHAEEALRFGLISKICDNKDAVQSAALALAREIASKSPIGIIGTKRFLNYSRDHSIPDTLDYITAWNQGMLQTGDMVEAITAFVQKRKPKFSKL